jgi:hypothetical protein
MSQLTREASSEARQCGDASIMSSSIMQWATSASVTAGKLAELGIIFSRPRVGYQPPQQGAPTTSLCDCYPRNPDGPRNAAMPYAVFDGSRVRGCHRAPSMALRHPAPHRWPTVDVARKATRARSRLCSCAGTNTRPSCGDSQGKDRNR